jgi:hypothetical protein
MFTQLARTSNEVDKVAYWKIYYQENNLFEQRWHAEKAMTHCR